MTPMPERGIRIEAYAFLSDTQTGALVSRDGYVDWLCLPRFDSGAGFASLLGEQFERDQRIARSGSPMPRI
jgi:GH15 family glucan-1,4-alpha-glucosidase